MDLEYIGYVATFFGLKCMALSEIMCILSKTFQVISFRQENLEYIINTNNQVSIQILTSVLLFASSKTLSQSCLDFRMAPDLTWS